MSKSVCFVIVCLLAIASLTQSQTSRADEPAGPPLSLRFYDIRDLIESQSSLLGDLLEPNGQASVTGLHHYGSGQGIVGGGMGGMGGGMGGMGGGMGGMGGGMGGMGGMSHASDGDVSLAELMELIRSSCGAEGTELGWEELGGRSTMRSVSHLLAIRTVNEVHQEIDSLLTSLRQSLRSTPTFEIAMRMVVLDDATSAELRACGPEQATSLATKIAEKSEESVAVSLRCGNGRVGSIESGVRKSFVMSVVPVVGSDGGSESRGNRVGYSPQIITPMIGLIGKVRPVLVPAQADTPRSVRIAMGVALSEGDDEVQSITYGTGDTIDRLSVRVTQLETQVTLPENTWSLSGVTALNGTSTTQVAFLVRWREAK